MRIRAARDDELVELQEIERAAGELFRDIGMAAIADDEPLPVEVLAEYVSAGRAWVAVVTDPDLDDGTGRGAGRVGPLAVGDHREWVAGYLIADLVDGNVHIEQVSVHPRFSRRGVGRRLIDETAAYAERVGAAGLTLTTFAEVAWNAPYYRRCGFVVLADEAVGSGLRAVRAHEAAAGLERWARVCMGRTLGGARPMVEP
ncbi:GNAT family N-acetyltransferase [Actinoplanes derwentensis]|uniref:Acetyltransferase (GNAT) domain-containing protein n=1 Tax=Actinoplanes derwentensis TaxID=113562 RepID=A0A1H1ZK78_9ACTN|nr:GNAT family N-acetyltransferase [Actinoplanes derwentensis]GID82489.1 GCN5 family N-acetyltransferase [Actinoplanes derwentensis]SDT34205.1 Acetyltransferase (GNAT) domain-containing protein [Actinoplanes derwentensis]